MQRQKDVLGKEHMGRCRCLGLDGGIMGVYYIVNKYRNKFRCQEDSLEQMVGSTGRELKGESELPGVRLYQGQRSVCAKACVWERELDLLELPRGGVWGWVSQ